LKYKLLTKCLAVGAVCCAFAGLPPSEAKSVLAATKPLFASVDRTGHVALENTAGNRVSSVHAGLVVLTVRDKSNRQNFHLIGADPSIKARTGIAFVGTVKWRLSLVPGIYRYYSDRNRSSGRTLRVTR